MKSIQSKSIFSTHVQTHAMTKTKFVWVNSSSIWTWLGWTQIK